MWHDPMCLEPTKRLANEIGVSKEKVQGLRQRSMLSKNAVTAYYPQKEAQEPIEAPSEECYTKAALWTDKCILEWYKFWIACEHQKMWHDPVCQVPSKRLAQSIGVDFKELKPKAKEVKENLTDAQKSKLSDLKTRHFSALPPIIAPSEHCYTKDALWEDECAKEWYLFWNSCNAHNKMKDPICAEPTKRLQDSV